MNLTIELTGLPIERRAAISTLTVSVAGDAPDPYVHQISDVAAIQSGEVRARYVPTVSNGTLSFVVEGLIGSAQVAGIGRVDGVTIESDRTTDVTIRLMLPLGTECSDATQCDSAHCIDGFCCDSDCAGQCEACDLPGPAGALGICQTVPSGSPHGHRPPCVGAGSTCAGACDGVSASDCTYPTTPCGATTCSGTTEMGSICMSGTCVAGAVLQCTNDFACSGPSCATSCNPANDGGCRTNSFCFVSGATCLNQVAFGSVMVAKPGASEFLVTRDFNGDGLLDVAMTQSGSNAGARVLLGNGDGTFTLKPTLAGNGNTVQMIAAGDFDGNGHPDLAFVNANAIGGPIASIYLGNGDGTFSFKTAVPVGNGPYGIAAADVSADGRDDLVITNSGDSNYLVLFGNGDGTFAAQPTAHSGTSPGPVVIADTNADGKRDLLILDRVDHTVSVFLGNGNGTFAPKSIAAVGSSSTDFAMADLDGDKKPDLVTTSIDDHPIWILRGLGDGTFQKKIMYALSNAVGQPYGVAIADLNHDGFADLAISTTVNIGNSSFMDIFLNDGHATFQLKQTLALGNEPRANAVGDLNGDGKPDLVVVLADLSSPNELDVFLNTSP